MEVDPSLAELLQIEVSFFFFFIICFWGGGLGRLYRSATLDYFCSIPNRLPIK